MVYKFRLLSDEVENFRRDIEIDADATFIELHNAILESVNYPDDQMTSFFICSEPVATASSAMLWIYSRPL